MTVAVLCVRFVKLILKLSGTVVGLGPTVGVLVGVGVFVGVLVAVGVEVAVGVGVGVGGSPSVVKLPHPSGSG